MFFYSPSASLMVSHHEKDRSRKVSEHTGLEGCAKVLDIRIAEDIHAGIIKCARDAVVPFFNDVYVLERRANGDIQIIQIGTIRLLLSKALNLSAMHRTAPVPS